MIYYIFVIKIKKEKECLNNHFAYIIFILKRYNFQII